jgi:hypothetical protein
MTHPVVTFGRIKIEEGNVLSFKVLNIVALQDNRDYYILEDPNGVKHFIDAELYANYGIELGNRLECRIDKINCTGRIILEPLHPIYSNGQSYYFNLISSEECGQEYKVTIEDIFRNKIELQIASEIFFASRQENFIKCKVIHLKKGIPEVEIVQ